eukprot:TRINITY_DN1481_c1_g1_i1.p1 TRINITY_DN1481_c1_g1~~TRINITY_DN1481_c1_g1_i1.p1  ORF type:complete len:169 (-),score=48.92 TRINITY_DN1481_c1_g1_i1:92-598(-)
MAEEEGKWRATSSAVIFDDNKRLLVARRLKNPDIHQFVQGGVDEGETELESIIREIGEEVGLDTKKEGFVLLDDKYQHSEHYTVKRPTEEFIGKRLRFFLFHWPNADITRCKYDTHVGKSGVPEFSEGRWSDWKQLVLDCGEVKRPMYQALADVLPQRIDEYFKDKSS